MSALKGLPLDVHLPTEKGNNVGRLAASIAGAADDEEPELADLSVGLRANGLLGPGIAAADEAVGDDEPDEEAQAVETMLHKIINKRKEARSLSKAA
jgi:hypothetical protein